MKWITVIILSLLVMQASARQSSRNGVKSKRNSGTRTVRLDPLLRKALLRALTELEREAQEKIKLEEEEKAKAEKIGKRGNDLQESEIDSSIEEIQNTADTKYQTPAPVVSSPEPETDSPAELTTTTTIEPETTEPPLPVTVKDTLSFHRSTPVEHEFTSPGIQETRIPDPTVSPPEVESNLILEPKIKENFIEATDKPEELITTQRTEVELVTQETTTTEPEKDSKSSNETEVELFQAPLVAAFTLHQDSRGTPHSVVPLLKPERLQQNLNFFQHQQRFINRPQPIQQQQFIPSVTITPLSEPNNFNQAQRTFGSTNTPSSTAFPPLVSNSISSILPSQSFQFSTTASPVRNNHNNQGFVSTSAPLISSTPSFASTPAPFVSSTAPPRGLSSVSTGKPKEIGSDVSIVQSHVFNLPSDLVAPAINAQQTFTTFNIPRVTLPLQNEPRLPLSFQDNQNFVNRQNQVQEQNRLRQVEDSRHNKAAQLRQEGFAQLQQGRPNPPVDFQRSVGFEFEITPKPAVNRLPQINNPFSFNIQQSQSQAFEDIETRNRVNRQEGFGSTGNLGLNRPVNQIPQIQKDQRGFQNNQPQFQQQFTHFQQLQQYRTIPDEHYRALQSNRFQQLQDFNHFQPNNFHFRQPALIQPQVPPVTKQLENLLIQSGVAAGDASRQEDLNIVSKVLALNHERADIQYIGNRRFSLNDRTKSENAGKLLVGEIAEQ